MSLRLYKIVNNIFEISKPNSVADISCVLFHRRALEAVDDMEDIGNLYKIHGKVASA